MAARGPRPVRITLQLDDPSGIPAHLATMYAGAAKAIRLVPCKGGVRVYRAGRAGPRCSSPQALRRQFQDLAFSARTRLTGEPTATECYWAESALFMDWAAWHATRNSAILALFGLEDAHG